MLYAEAWYVISSVCWITGTVCLHALVTVARSRTLIFVGKQQSQPQRSKALTSLLAVCACWQDYCWSDVSTTQMVTPLAPTKSQQLLPSFYAYDYLHTV